MYKRQWSICVDDVVTSSFELIVAQNYAPVPVRKGETAREVAKTWCVKRDIPEQECDMISATICREAVARGYASSTPAKPTGIAVTEGSRVMARRDGTFQRGVARSVTGKYVDVLFDDGQHQNTSVFDVRALPSPKEPAKTNPSYVWAAVAALQQEASSSAPVTETTWPAHHQLQVTHVLGSTRRRRNSAPAVTSPLSRSCSWSVRRRLDMSEAAPDCSPTAMADGRVAPTGMPAADGLLRAGGCRRR